MASRPPKPRQAAGSAQRRGEVRVEQRCGEHRPGGRRDAAEVADAEAEAVRARYGDRMPVPAQRHRRVLLGEDRRELAVGCRAQPRQPGRRPSPAGDRHARSQRREGSGDVPRVARARSGATRGEVGEPAARPEPEELVAAESGDDSSPRGMFQHGREEVGVGREEQTVLRELRAGDGSDHVESLGQVDPDPVRGADVSDHALLPPALLRVGRGREAQRHRDRRLQAVPALCRAGGGEQERRVPSAREGDDARRPPHRPRDRVDQGRGGRRAPRSTSHPRPGRAAERKAARGLERRETDRRQHAPCALRDHDDPRLSGRSTPSRSRCPRRSSCRSCPRGRLPRRTAC